MPAVEPVHSLWVTKPVWAVKVHRSCPRHTYPGERVHTYPSSVPQDRMPGPASEGFTLLKKQERERGHYLLKNLVSFRKNHFCDLRQLKETRQ